MEQFFEHGVQFHINCLLAIIGNICMMLDIDTSMTLIQNFFALILTVERDFPWFKLWSQVESCLRGYIEAEG